MDPITYEIRLQHPCTSEWLLLRIFFCELTAWLLIQQYVVHLTVGKKLRNCAVNKVSTTKTKVITFCLHPIDTSYRKINLKFEPLKNEAAQLNCTFSDFGALCACDNYNPLSMIIDVVALSDSKNDKVGVYF